MNESNAKEKRSGSLVHMPRLVTLSGKIYPLKSPYMVGREDACDLHMNDTQVSRQHCFLQEDSAGNWWITDQKSTNGTYVNKHKIVQATQLADKDAVIIGTQEFYFYAPESLPEVSIKEDVAIPSAQANSFLLMGDVEDVTSAHQGASEEAMSQHLGEWSRACADLIEASNGKVNKFLGDGFLAYWKEGDCAPVELIDALGKMAALSDAYPFRFRLVLHFGSVQIGDVMTEGEESLSGVAVNFVFKAEKVAAELGNDTFISEAAAQEIGPETLQAVGEHRVPGFPEAFLFYELSTLS